jgi:hypothetical protein
MECDLGNLALELRKLNREVVSFEYWVFEDDKETVENEKIKD